MRIEFALRGASCEYGGLLPGYEDIEPGNPIKVRDENNTLLASTSLPDHGE